MKTTFSLVAAGLVVFCAAASAADLPVTVASAADAANTRSEAAVDAPAKPARRAKTGSTTPAERAAAPAPEKDVWAVPLFQNAKALNTPR
ncbi:hypothetical protein [Piscinibacter koreensis]|uniref:Uncharacterized protein n=1 Tax=Piscinibacter koreensis TaxID=2742824 RepID=A0A7Y6NR19_9BURK|nr:hypothetical protein [Schlegelella koreensis]NUZ07734.1 hypothetical protein [Schlegelella koreensis]